VPNVALTWQASGLLAIAFVIVASVAERFAPDEPRRWWKVAPFGREVGIILGLYSLWQLAGGLSLGHTGEAVTRGLRLWHIERSWHFPNEATMQRPILHNSFLVQASNIYYATMHFGMLLVVLLWLYFRHRDAYLRTRTLIVLTTTACLLVDLVPVAPPRLISVGMVDTAVLYGQSVYAVTAHVGADQYSAMPSVHVAWAALVAIAVITATRSKWRWLILVHTALTMYVVVVTANHFWLDGVVAVALLGVSLALMEISGRVVKRTPRERVASSTTGRVPEPVLAELTMAEGPTRSSL
jgi:hypothetical protein